MSLRARQSRFVKMVQLLVGYADLCGYELTYGDCYRDERCGYGHPRSLHRQRLAVDFNLFENGVYLSGDDARAAHNKLHDFWDLLGGNERIKSDLNHYSLSDGHSSMR
jgi:hypothetical protein